MEESHSGSTSTRATAHARQRCARTNSATRNRFRSTSRKCTSVYGTLGWSIRGGKNLLVPNLTVGLVSKKILPHNFDKSFTNLPNPEVSTYKSTF